MSKVLLAGFLGVNNSSKIILDKASSNLEKLYLKNDFKKCEEQIKSAISSNRYQYIFALGQKPIIKSIYIELVGCSNETSFQTNFNYAALLEYLSGSGYKVKTSSNAGNYLCNHVYFHGLKEIYLNSYKTHMIFIHTPYLKNISDTKHLANTFSNFFLSL